eukprot:7401028-Alexandrium_andersonii.AAC.1
MPPHHPGIGGRRTAADAYGVRTVPSGPYPDGPGRLRPAASADDRRVHVAEAAPRRIRARATRHLS